MKDESQVKYAVVLWKSGGKFRESMERARFNAWAPDACHPYLGGWGGHEEIRMGRPSNMVHGL